MRRPCLLLLAAQAGCAAPLQNGDAVIAHGVSARLEVMCRYRNGASAKQVKDVCGEGGPLARSRVAILGPSDCSPGTCSPGDVVLENASMRVLVAGSATVVGGVDRPAGTILSASLRGASAATPGITVSPAVSLGDLPLRFDFSRAVAVVDDDGTATLEVPTAKPGGFLRYELRAELPVLRLLTSHDTPPGEPRPWLTDQLHAAREQEKTYLERAWAFAGENASLAYVAMGAQPFERVWVPTAGGQWKLAPNVRAGKLLWRRALVLTEPGTLASAAAVARLTGAAVGAIEVSLDTDWTQPPEGARVVFRRDDLVLWAPLTRGLERFDVPEGAWRVELTLGGLPAETELARADGDVVPRVRFALPEPQSATPLR